GDAGAEQAEEGGLVGGHRRKGKQRKVGHTLRARERSVKRLLAWLAVLGLLPLSAAAQNVTYIHTDALGSPVLETNAQAQVVRQVDYRAYGMEVMDAPRPGPGYTGHYRDVGTGLVYMQQRYYDPAIGRFLSVDPMASDMRNGWNFNRYNYAANNPYRFTDPDGRTVEIVNDEKRVVADIDVVAKWDVAVNRGGLEMTNDSPGGPAYYQQRLTEAIAAEIPIRVQVNTTYVDGQGISRSTDDAGGGVTVPRYVDGKLSGVDVIYSGNANAKVGAPPEQILAHEFVAHAIPLVVGSDTGSGIDNENKVNGEVGRPLRPRDPGHKEF